MTGPEREDSMNTKFDGKNLHTLIAGVSGSGKSTLVREILDSLIAAGNAELVLIDPKRTELVDYRDRMQTDIYAARPDDIADALDVMATRLEDRQDSMANRGLRVWDGSHTFIVVDEMAFLMQGPSRKAYVQILQDIAMLGRAARMHLILCTQVATQDVIPACIRDNMANVVCLRQRDAGKYRYLLGCFPGRLPQFGKCYVFTPDMFDRPERVDTSKAWDRIVGA